jgi:hypothetical protein
MALQGLRDELQLLHDYTADTMRQMQEKWTRDDLKKKPNPKDIETALAATTDQIHDLRRQLAECAEMIESKATIVKEFRTGIVANGKKRTREHDQSYRRWDQLFIVLLQQIKAACIDSKFSKQVQNLRIHLRRVKAYLVSYCSDIRPSYNAGSGRWTIEMDLERVSIGGVHCKGTLHVRLNRLTKTFDFVVQGSAVKPTDTMNLKWKHRDQLDETIRAIMSNGAISLPRFLPAFMTLINSTTLCPANSGIQDISYPLSFLLFVAHCTYNVAPNENNADEDAAGCLSLLIDWLHERIALDFDYTAEEDNRIRLLRMKTEIQQQGSALEDIAEEAHHHLDVDADAEDITEEQEERALQEKEGKWVAGAADEEEEEEEEEQEEERPRKKRVIIDDDNDEGELEVF